MRKRTARGGRQPNQECVRPHMILITQPQGPPPSRIVKHIADLLVQECAAQTPVEAVDERVLGRLCPVGCSARRRRFGSAVPA